MRTLWIERFLERHFQLELIDGHGRQLYLKRWVLWRGTWRGKAWAVYLHRFIGSDWSRDLHDHPKRFISIGLAGTYYEQTPGWGDSGVDERRFRAPWIRSFPADHLHRLRIEKPVWTLCVVGEKTREWGFVQEDGRWVPWHVYVYDPDTDARVAVD